MLVDTIIKNGKIATTRGVYKAGIAIDDGKIVAVAKEPNLPKANSILDISGNFVIPGPIDTHVHIYDPEFIKETFETGTQAAAVGGVTTVLEMPTVGEQATTTVAGFRWKKKIGEKEAVVDFGLYGGEIMEEKDTLEIADLVREGVVGFKVTFGGGPTAAKNDGIIIDSFQRIAKTGSLASVHAENQQLFFYFKDKVIAEGCKDPVAHSKSRPNIVEAEAILRAALLSRWAGNRVHIAHMSTKEGVELVREAKERGQRITAEVCPHHLLLTKKDYTKFGPYIAINPPVRSKEDVAALWVGLADGTVDALATDHCAFSKNEKDIGWSDIWKTPPGIPNLETGVTLILSEGVNKGRITLERFVGVTSENPARIFGLYPRKGAIEVGSDADLTVVDLKRKHTITADQLRSAGDFTPFDGWKVKGKPILTMVRGAIVAQEGEVVAKPGHGCFIPAVRQYTS